MGKKEKKKPQSPEAPPPLWRATSGLLQMPLCRPHQLPHSGRRSGAPRRMPDHPLPPALARECSDEHTPSNKLRVSRRVESGEIHVSSAPLSTHTGETEHVKDQSCEWQAVDSEEGGESSRRGRGTQEPEAHSGPYPSASASEASAWR